VHVQTPREPSLDRLAALDTARVPRDIRRVRPDELGWAVVVPGGTTMRRAPVLGALLLLMGVLAPLAIATWAVVERDRLLSLVLDQDYLTGIVLVGFAAMLARFAAVTEVTVALRRSPRRRAGAGSVFAYVVLVALSIPVGLGIVRADDARDLVGEVFADGGSTTPLYVPPVGEAGRPGTTNVLLLGGDEGPGRWGLRTDSMILVSIDEASGRTSLVSIPRNLARLQFPPGSAMAARYPDGFDDLANAVYPRVFANADLRAEYAIDGLPPEAVALAEGIGYSLGVAIDDFVLVNMQGFLEVVDAVGGVTLTLDRSVPLPPSIPGGKRPIPTSVGPGVVEMDGTLAIAYARSRYADSDYGRMARQRGLLSAMAQQVSVADAALRFGSISDALAGTLRTSLTADEFADLVDSLGGTATVTESVGLVPPLVEPGRPDYAQIKRIVDEVHLAIATGTLSPYTATPGG
jgi:LCP family protein required for cell wall assembly